jgi:isopenicillin N synthase-like dioxygenase
MADSTSLPVIHLSWDPQTLAERLRQAANTSGFFYLLDHGIEAEEIQQAFTLSKDFFENTPNEERVKYAFDTTAGCVGPRLPEVTRNSLTSLSHG